MATPTSLVRMRVLSNVGSSLLRKMSASDAEATDGIEEVEERVRKLERKLEKEKKKRLKAEEELEAVVKKNEEETDEDKNTKEKGEEKLKQDKQGKGNCGKKSKPILELLNRVVSQLWFKYRKKVLL